MTLLVHGVRLCASGNTYMAFPERANAQEAKNLRHTCFCVDGLTKTVEKVACEEIRADWFGRRFTFCEDPDG